MLTDIVSLSNIAVAVFALAALYLTRVQLRSLGDQIEETNRLSISQAYSEISQTATEISNIFLDHPEWYPYFYKGEEVSQESKDQGLRNQLEHISEMFLDFLDSCLSCATLHHSPPWTGPSRRIISVTYLTAAPRCAPMSSTALTPFPIISWPRWASSLSATTSAARSVESWHAREFDEGDESHAAALRRLWGDEWRAHLAPEGYPWVRTWVMRRTGMASRQ